ncbi:hypothetical protein MMC17_006446 [Xylographa soralifera]|nr:hypothetical protein [Xylographa soralifera]
MSLPSLTRFHLQTPAPILTLPTELHLAIIAYLPFSARQFLRLTSHHFATLFPPFSTHPALLAAEQDPGARDLNIFACAVCLRLRRGGKFADRLRKARGEVRVSEGGDVDAVWEAVCELQALFAEEAEEWREGTGEYWGV